MAGAYYEKIARINLTTGKIKVEPLDLGTCPQVHWRPWSWHQDAL